MMHFSHTPDYNFLQIDLVLFHFFAKFLSTEWLCLKDPLLKYKPAFKVLLGAKIN